MWKQKQEHNTSSTLGQNALSYLVPSEHSSPLNYITDIFHCNSNNRVTYTVVSVFWLGWDTIPGNDLDNHITEVPAWITSMQYNTILILYTALLYSPPSDENSRGHVLFKHLGLRGSCLLAVPQQNCCLYGKTASSRAGQRWALGIREVVPVIFKSAQRCFFTSAVRNS